jgi:hypothetical protein
VKRIPNKLPKGTRRKDYAPEVLAEFDRKRWRRVKAGVRKRKRFREGIRPVTFDLGKESRDIMRRLCKERGLTQSQLFTQLLEKENVQPAE